MTGATATSREIPTAAIDHLGAADPVMQRIINEVGTFEPTVQSDLWWSLVDSIGSQQLSIKAAATIVGRIAMLGQGNEVPGPAELLEVDDTALRACGLSGAKVKYVKDLAAKWLDGTLDPDLLPNLSDDEVVDHLTQVKGIGRWTAEMALIFTLQRPDVLPVDDLGLRNAVQRAYGLDERPGRAELTEIGEPWRPYRSAATLYLWRSLKNSPK